MFIYDARRSTYSLAALISYLAPQPNLQGRQGGLEHAQDQGAESGRPCMRRRRHHCLLRE